MPATSSSPGTWCAFALLLASRLIGSPSWHGGAMLAAGALLCHAAWRDGLAASWLRHGWCLLMLLASLLVPCRSLCSDLPSAAFATLPIAWWGCLVHGVAAAAWLRRGGSEPINWASRADGVAVLASAAAIGAAASAAWTMLQHAWWCDDCADAHLAMLAQCICLVRSAIDAAPAPAGAAQQRQAQHRQMRWAGCALVSVMLLTGQLVGQALAQAEPGPGPAVALADPPSAERQARSLRARAPRLPAAPARVQPPAAVPSPADHPEAGPPGPDSGRSSDLADTWGDPDAPVLLMAGLNPQCPICAAQMEEIGQVGDLVAAHQLRVRFLLTYRHDRHDTAADAMASLAYCAGFASQRALVATLTAFMRSQARIRDPDDALDQLPQELPPWRALAILRSHRDDITALLQRAAITKRRLGAQGDPMLWLVRSAGGDDVRTYTGWTPATVLRVAIAALLH